MNVTILQECPQCGAPIELTETDRLIRCPYCGVNNYLYSPDYYRIFLPHNAGDKDIFYAPYLRFKGTVFFCNAHRIDHRFMDITHAGLSFNGLPWSLGLRPQAMKMRFISSRISGSFLHFSQKTEDVLNKAGSIVSSTSSGSVIYQVYIGETLSLIYLPLYIHSNTLFDAIENKPIFTPIDYAGIRKAFQIKQPEWSMTFVPTLCPRCGENMDGERDSVVLTCCNCESAWEVQGGTFARLDVWYVPAENEYVYYLPFWEIKAEIGNMPIRSFADFIRETHQPKTIKAEWENEEMRFWCPAFKIRPRLFLNLSKQLTINQMIFIKERQLPGENLYPATLPRTEALQAMKIILANAAANKIRLLSRLSDIQFDIRKSALVYLPFEDRVQEMVQEQLPIAINRNTLRFGRQL